jgi:hypothetical protein
VQNKRFLKPIFASNHSPITNFRALSVRVLQQLTSLLLWIFPAFAGILTDAVVSALPAVAGVPVTGGVSAMAGISTVAGVSDNTRTLSVPAIDGTLFVAGVTAIASVSVPAIAGVSLVLHPCCCWSSC